MNIQTTSYADHHLEWPQSGRHIMAQFDETSVVVYQAYSESIAKFAVENNHFGGPHFSLSRMSWIKPNFLWMMYRCGWSSKEGQERTLAIRLRRAAFDEILGQAVHSIYERDIYSSREDWKSELNRSSVRLQWDPDHGPSGAPVARRAIQLGLRGETLAKFAREWILAIEDLTDFVHQQAANALSSPHANLLVPVERCYPVNDPLIARRLQLASLTDVVRD